MSDFNIWDIVSDHLTEPSHIKVNRLPTFYPSAASCIDETDGTTVLGGCNRAQFYRCAGYEKTNPSGLFSQYIFAAGNMWEDWVTAQLKEAGVWLANSVKFQDIPRYISGEIDILVRDPDTGEKVIVENKTYSSGNYKAKKELCGTKYNDPKPKDQNLLQSFLYLGHFDGQDINKVALTYFDRACGGPENNVQFMITMTDDGGAKRPVVSTNFRGRNLQYVDKRISIQGIYDRYEALMNHLKEGELPNPDYQYEYSDERVQREAESGIIAKTRYENWQRDKNKYPIGDWQCTYCDYRDQCISDQNG